MSRRSTGNKYEKYAKAWLESQNYTVHRAQNSGSKRGNFWVSNNNDLWNCIDLAAIKPGERPLFVQVTAASVGIGTKTKKMNLVPWDKQYSNVQIWFYHGGRYPEGQYFQIRKLDEDYALKESNRIYLSPEFRNAK